MVLIFFCAGFALSAADGRFAYVVGQVVLAFAFLHAFVLLHEAGHDTLFPMRRLNRVVGHLAGFLTLIPFWNWQRIHARHHRYTGWQDLDATTASLTPRTHRWWEQTIVNVAWATWLPLFSVTYRLQNFWYLPRVSQFITNPRTMRRIRWNTLAVLPGYGMLLVVVGPLELFHLAGPGFLASLVFQEVLILSQHTHVPQRLSWGEPVTPFTTFEQEEFTRSLRLPGLLSVLLLHFDAHELHHMYPQVPGYRLRRIAYRPRHEVDWWRWLLAVRRLRGTDFFFRNWDETGVRM